MESINKGFTNISGLLGEQEVSLGSKYRPITFCKVVECDDGYIAAYNTLTGELNIINEDERAIIEGDIVVADESHGELIRKWFLVPQEHDDMELRDEIFLFLKSLQTPKKLKAYVVFPTTDCNARCFYCFELGRSRLNMSEKTASDVADYILKTYDTSEEKISLSWFGGEPLFNDTAIDIITARLKDANVAFDSKMISNAYLFDDVMVKKAVELWKLSFVQVTLDGTEDVYNKAKAYIYRDGKSAFNIVMDNIDRLLNSGIKVSVRLNMDNYNYEDLNVLVDILAERFGGRKGISVYSNILYEQADRPNTLRTDEQRLAISEKWLSLENKISESGLDITKFLPQNLKASMCMADSDASVNILPDGHLGKCEHYTDDHFIGDIYNGITDKALVDNFAIPAKTRGVCDGCYLYPICYKIADCPSYNFLTICDYFRKAKEDRKITKSIAATVKLYLKKRNRT